MASADGARAILNGVGGDEWLGGGREYSAEELKQGHLFALLECFAHDRSAFGSAQAMKWFLRYGLFELAPRGVQAVLRNAVRFARGTGLEDKYWLSDSMKQRIKERRDNFRSQAVPGSLPRQSQYQLMMTLHDAYLALAREEGERQYAVFGLEPRRPLHTAAFVEFAFSTPARLRVKGDRDKYIHVQALRQEMPQSILERKEKAQFSSMFRRYLDEMASQLTNDLPMRRTDWVSKGGMARLFHAYKEFPHHGWPLWILWSLYGSDLMVTACEGDIQSSLGNGNEW